VVIVTEIGDCLVGLMVDAVCDILTLDEGMLQPAPDMGAPRVHEFVRGMITTNDGIVTLLARALRPRTQSRNSRALETGEIIRGNHG
jgi:chemotaxis signal transduction protein